MVDFEVHFSTLCRVLSTNPIIWLSIRNHWFQILCSQAFTATFATTTTLLYTRTSCRRVITRPWTSATATSIQTRRTPTTSISTPGGLTLAIIFSFRLTSQPFFGYRYISTISATGTIVVVCFCRCCHSLVQVMVSADLPCITSLLFYTAARSEGWVALYYGEDHSSGLYSTGGAPEQIQSLLRNLELRALKYVYRYSDLCI